MLEDLKGSDAELQKMLFVYRFLERCIDLLVGLWVFVGRWGGIQQEESYSMKCHRVITQSLEAQPKEIHGFTT